MTQAKVKWWSDNKGFGFLTYENKDVFVHYSEIKSEGFKTLSENQLVEFEMYETEKGLHAKNVVKL